VKQKSIAVASLILSSHLLCQTGALAEAAAQDATAGSARTIKSMSLTNSGLPLPLYLDKALAQPESIEHEHNQTGNRIEKANDTKDGATAANVSQDGKSDAATQAQANAAAQDGSAGQGLSTLIKSLMPLAEANDEQYLASIKLIAKHNTFGGRLGARTSDMLNYATLFKGVSPSSEAGDVILTEKIKLKSVASAKYIKQKTEDDIEQHLTTDVIQMAAAMGEEASFETRQDYLEATADIKKFCGDEGLDQAKTFLKDLAASNGAPQPAPQQPWTPNELKERVTQAVTTASEGDPVIIQIKQDVHHYNKHSKGTMAAHRAVRIGLSTASLTPTFVGPAANTLLFIYLGIAGGTEQEKLLKEMYIDKRLNSRVTLLNEMAHMALHNHQVAALTHNNLLAGVSDLLLARMTGKDEAAKLLAMKDAGQ